MITGRLVVAIVSTLMELTVIAFGILWGLPRLGVNIPYWSLVTILIPVMILWIMYSVFIYRKGSLALNRSQPVGMQNMIGTKGVVVKPLAPEGMVSIRSELWQARSEEGKIKAGTRIIVTGQERLKLVVTELKKDG